MTELENRPSIKETIIITKENLPIWRQEIANLREIPRKERETLNLIRPVLKGADRLGERKDVVELYWEKYLIGKHLAMAARDKSGLWDLPLKALGIGKGYLLMKDSAYKAEKYINKHQVENCRPRSGRFLGEIAIFEKRYDKAISHFQKSINLFNQIDDWSQRVNSLEISGFLAESLILSGQTEEGIDIIKNKFKAYNEGDGVKLKENDYYTWAVWKSGLLTKGWHAILAKKVLLDENNKKLMINLLNSAEKILVIPEGQKTWGNKNFEIRKNEIKAIKKSIGI